VKAWDAIGIGLAVRDVSVLMDRYPRADEKIRAREIHEAGGGPVPTALVTLARFGRKTTLSALVGDDAVGRFILDGLSRESVDVGPVTVKPGYESGTSVIIVENGRRTILEAPRGVGFPLEWEDVRQLPLDECSALLLDARVPEVQIRAARIARDAGALVVVDCGHPRDGAEELIAESNVAILSHTYPRTLHGDDFDVKAFLQDVLERLPRSGPGVAGITLGPRGCAMLSRTEGYLRLEAHPVEALDTTGAGDVFHGAFAHAFLQTGSVERSARFANVTAALKCKGMSGRAPIPSEEEIWRLAMR
jgi:sugar/nucleoside kinase (ribokinase family)